MGKLDLSKFKDFKQEQDEMGSGGNNDIFMPKSNKQGEQEYVLRFLPQRNEAGKIDSGEFFFEEWRKHNFKVGDSSFNKLCPRTIGKTCHICDNGSAIWDSSEALYRKVKARVSYLFLVQIVDYEEDPSLNGKIMYWYASKDFLTKTLLPVLTDKKEPNPIHDLKEGCNVGVTVKETKDKGREYSARFYKNSDISKIIKDEDILNIRDFINSKIKSITDKVPDAFEHERFKADYLAMFPDIVNTPKKAKIQIEVEESEPVHESTEPELDIDDIANDIVN
jgi:hypothetical protein